MRPWPVKNKEMILEVTEQMARCVRRNFFPDTSGHLFFSASVSEMGFQYFPGRFNGLGFIRTFCGEYDFVALSDCQSHNTKDTFGIRAFVALLQMYGGFKTAQRLDQLSGRPGMDSQWVFDRIMEFFHKYSASVFYGVV